MFSEFSDLIHARLWPFGLRSIDGPLWITVTLASLYGISAWISDIQKVTRGCWGSRSPTKAGFRKWPKSSHGAIGFLFWTTVLLIVFGELAMSCTVASASSYDEACAPPRRSPHTPRSTTTLSSIPEPAIIPCSCGCSDLDLSRATRRQRRAIARAHRIPNDACLKTDPLREWIRSALT